MTAIQEIIDRAKEVSERITDEEDSAVVYALASIMQRFEDYAVRASAAMSDASKEIISLRQQVAASRQGAALLALEKEQEKSKALIEGMQAIVTTVTAGFIDTAKYIAKSTLEEHSK